MLDTDDLALWYALNRLMTNYWADVDSNGGAQAHEFYLPDALYAVGNNRFEGEEKICAFYARRRYGTVLTRHLVSNLRVFATHVCISGQLRRCKTWVLGPPRRRHGRRYPARG